MRHLLRPTAGDAACDDDDDADSAALELEAAALGIDLAQLEAAPPPDGTPDGADDVPDGADDVPDGADDVCDVWPEHFDALRLMSACLGQLRIVAGLQAASWHEAHASDVRQEMEWLGITEPARQRELAAQYKLMQHQALKVLNERAAQAGR